MAHDEPLDPAVEALVLAELPASQCIDGWTVLPNDDLLVFLIDRDLQRAIAPFVAAAGRPRPGCGPTLVFAHNSHLQRPRSEMQMLGEPLGWWSAGAHLGLRLGTGYAFVATHWR